MPVGFALIRYSTMKLAPQAGGSGIPQVMAVIHVGRVRAMLKTFVSPLQALYKMILVISACCVVLPLVAKDLLCKSVQPS